MDNEQHTEFGASRSYTHQMKPYFHPFQVIGNALAKFDINPYIIKTMHVIFRQEDDQYMYNTVTVRVSLDIPMSGDWIEYMKNKLERLLEEAFMTSYQPNKVNYPEPLNLISIPDFLQEREENETKKD